MPLGPCTADYFRKLKAEKKVIVERPPIDDFRKAALAYFSSIADNSSVEGIDITDSLIPSVNKGCTTAIKVYRPRDTLTPTAGVVFSQAVVLFWIWGMCTTHHVQR